MRQWTSKRLKKAMGRIIWIVVLLWLAGCAGSRTPSAGSPASWKKFREEGKASYYANSLHGRKMANGQPYRKGKMTAAHKQLPLGTKVKVTNPRTGRSVKVTITDRGPFVKGRIVDLSLKAARKMNMVDAGVIPVRLKVVRVAKGSAIE